MQWEIVVGVILVIGIYAAIVEARAKRMTRRNEDRGAQTERHPVREAAKKQDKQI